MEHMPQQYMEQILKQIKEPVFPSLELSILDFGAKAGSSQCQTTQIQAAIDHAHAAGGGTVHIPSGTFLTGALRLKSGVCLNLDEEDSILLFTTEMTQEHYPLVYSHWEATPCYNYSALIYACDAENIGLTGKGVLDAASSYDTWWGWHHQVENAWSADKPDLQAPARKALREMNENGVPVEERRFGDGFYLRPNFVQLIRCRRVLLSGVTLKNSPMWQLNPVMCDHLTVRGMTLSAHGCNSDGCDPESCQNVLIEGCRFDTGDDCISLKSGRDRDGRLAAAPCRNVVIRRNLFADGHGGIALGSEMSGGIENVYADDNRFESPNLTYVLRFKTNARRGGYIRNVWMNRSTATAVGAASIHATMLYEDGRNGDYLPVFENICIENLNAHGGDYGIFLEAFPEVPIRGLVLRNIEINGTRIPLRAMNWEAPVLENVKINGVPYPRPTEARILGIPCPGGTVAATAQFLGGDERDIDFSWWMSDRPCTPQAAPNSEHAPHFLGTGRSIALPADCGGLRLWVQAAAGGKNSPARFCTSAPYRILSEGPRTGSPSPAAGAPGSVSALRLETRGILPADACYSADSPITRREMARLLQGFCLEDCGNMEFLEAPYASSATPSLFFDLHPGDAGYPDASRAVASGLMAAAGGSFRPDELISRQEMATIAMQSCGVSYKNASVTMPVCADASQVNAVYGTNVARSLYFGFMECDSQNCFLPQAPVTWAMAVAILDRVADFAAK